MMQETRTRRRKDAQGRDNEEEEKARGGRELEKGTRRSGRARGKKERREGAVSSRQKCKAQKETQRKRRKERELSGVVLLLSAFSFNHVSPHHRPSWPWLSFFFSFLFFVACAGKLSPSRCHLLRSVRPYQPSFRFSVLFSFSDDPTSFVAFFFLLKILVLFSLFVLLLVFFSTCL